MKEFFLYTVSLLLVSVYCKAQNRVEILVNGELQTVSKEAFRVNSSDKIEIKIYPGSRSFAGIVDSLRTEGCGIYIKNKKGVFVPKDFQQQQQTASRTTEEKYIIQKSFRPVLKDRFIYFSFKVNDITACKGRNFNLVFKYNARQSPVASYSGFSNRYIFYNKL